MLLDYTDGRSGLYSTEDLYQVGDNQKIIIFDKAPNGTFNCVTGLISQDITMDIVSTWKSIFDQGGGAIGSLAFPILDIMSSFRQMTEGGSLRQPWMSRKMWQQTSPISFTIPVSFVATSAATAKQEVWVPALTLIGFMYPISVKGNASLTKDTSGSAFGTFMNSLTQQFTPPGPSIFYTGDTSENTKKHKQDPITVAIGDIILMRGVYLENANVTFSSTMTSTGVPMAATVTLKITAMDGNVRDETGRLTQLGADPAKYTEWMVPLKNALLSVKEALHIA